MNKVNKEEAQKAIKEGWTIGLQRIGRPDQPYEGRLLRELNDGTFWFEGNSGSEAIRGKVKPEEVFFIRKEE